ncbi:MAG: hypothetical protein M3069_02835 [Chloroflexota bacterium]|nr:hypothetical protein [Chloroflexota bacterium]
MRRPLLAVATILGSLSALPMQVHAQAAPHCPPGQAPQFVLGIGTLHQRLGDTMGQPLECEHPSADNGDTLQQTTTGLAYYRAATNAPSFTGGSVHYALVGGRVEYWRNSSVDPPQPTADETAYLASVGAQLEQVDALMAQLDQSEQLADQGRLDEIDVGDLGGLLDGLAAASRAVGDLEPSGRLTAYHAGLLDALGAGADAAETLLRARLTDNADARAAFVAQAEAQSADSRQLRHAATDAYSLALPVAVG